MTRRRALLITSVCGIALISISAVLLRSRFIPEPSGISALEEESHSEGDLFVPLASTVRARERFVKAYKTRRSRRARSLYEAYIDTVGANGLIHSILAVAPKCHDEGHDLGRVLYARLRDVAEALRTCNDTCASGCMHGVVMEFFSVAGESPGSHTHAEHNERVSPEMIERNIPSICGMTAFGDLYRPGDCAHGVGHAVTFLSEYDMKQAIGYCDRFDTYAMQYYCATGAYMEYTSERATSDYATRDAFYPCAESPYPAACFRYKLANTLHRHYARGGVLAPIESACMALRGKYRLGCFHGIGNAHMGLIASGRVKISEVCGADLRDDQFVCIEGAMERMGKFHPSVAAERCDDVSGWQKEVCLTSASRQMYDLAKSFALYER